MRRSPSSRIACVQMCSGRTPADNIDTVAKMVREAAAAGATFVATPEMTNVIEAKRADLIEKVGTQANDASVDALTGLARDLKITLLAGSLALRDAGDRLVNRSLLFAPDGSTIAHYDKVHMFDVELDNGERYHESRSYTAGSRAVVADTQNGRLGMTICYDLRFPALYRLLAQTGAEILAVPSAFTRPTGMAHWDVLLRARAIETGSYVVAPAQSGVHESGRKTYGHSLIISPWGEIIAEAGVDVGILVADIDLDAVHAARQRIPSLEHDRAFEEPRQSDQMKVAS